MSDAVCRLLFAIAAIVGVPLALAGLADLPPLGAEIPELGARIAERALAEREAPNAVAAVIFDYRAFDTLGEQFVLLAAVTGVALLFRDVRGYERKPLTHTVIMGRDVDRSPASVGLSRLLLPLGIVFGVYVVVYGHLSPGGGFQGGAILASAALAIFLAAGFEPWRRATPPAALDVTKALAAVSYAGLGLIGLLAGGAYLENVLPLGERGALGSGGTIPLLNLASGVGVTAGLVLLAHEFLTEVEPGAREEEEAQDTGQVR